MRNDPNDELVLLERARGGGPGAVNDLFTRHRDRLRGMVELRLDWRLQARLDASDVIQEAYLDVVRKLPDYLQQPNVPLFLWLRLVVGERLCALRRHHLGVHMRDAGLEVSLYRHAMPAASSTALAA